MLNTDRRRVGAEALVVVVAFAVDMYVYGGDRALRGGGELPPWTVPAVAAVVLATLPLRWRHPLPVFGVQWVHGLAGLLLPGYAPVAGLLVALHAAACRSRTAPAVLVLLLAGVPLVIDNVNAAAGSTSRLLALCAAWAVVLGSVWAIGRRTHRTDRRRVLAEDRASRAVRAERLRLARELHDIVSHTISAMILQAAGARALLTAGTAGTAGTADTADTAQVQDALLAVERSGVTAMKELHRLLGLLRTVDPDTVADDTTPQARLADLDELFSTSRSAGLDVERIVEGTETTLDRSVELAAFRVVQESLTNAVRHGGTGSLMRIHETWESDRLRITARSSGGVGPDTALPTGGFGLRGLAERVALIGGRLDAGPTDEGFLVRAELPLDRAP